MVGADGKGVEVALGFTLELGDGFHGHSALMAQPTWLATSGRDVWEGLAVLLLLWGGTAAGGDAVVLEVLLPSTRPLMRLDVHL